MGASLIATSVACFWLTAACHLGSGPRKAKVWKHKALDSGHKKSASCTFVRPTYLMGRTQQRQCGKVAQKGGWPSQNTRTIEKCKPLVEEDCMCSFLGIPKNNWQVHWGGKPGCKVVMSACSCREARSAWGGLPHWATCAQLLSLACHERLNARTSRSWVRLTSLVACSDICVLCLCDVEWPTCNVICLICQS